MGLAEGKDGKKKDEEKWKVSYFGKPDSSPSCPPGPSQWPPGTSFCPPGMSSFLPPIIMPYGDPSIVGPSPYVPNPYSLSPYGPNPQQAFEGGNFNPL